MRAHVSKDDPSRTFKNVLFLSLNRNEDLLSRKYCVSNLKLQVVYHHLLHSATTRFFSFIIADKARTKEKYINRGVGVMRGGESLPHTLWSGGIRYLRRGKWIRDEMFVSGRVQCVGGMLREHHRCKG